MTVVYLTLHSAPLLGVAMANAADASGDRQRAKELRDVGAAAVERRDFVPALDAFRRAYACYPSPNLRFDIGVALDQLGRWAEAIQAFEDFLAASSDAPTEGVDFASARIAALTPRVAQLEIVVTPADASVSVDGTPITMPRARALPVMPGEREIEASRAGRVTARQRLRLAAGDRRRIELQLLSPAAPPPRKPLYQRWWLWTTVGVVVGGAVALGVVLGQPDTTAPGARPVIWK
jgi:tetratricopeptide (TPR) repeat protein